MGGSIRREFSGRVTQLVANSIHGQKYRVSMSYMYVNEFLIKHEVENGWILLKLQ